MIRGLLLLPLLFLFTQSFAQQPTQTIRGTIVDELSHTPLPYASVNLEHTQIGSITDSLGNFIISNVPVGRYNLIARYSGYEPLMLNEIQVNSAKEVILNITLKQSSNTLKEVTIKPKLEKEMPLNPMALVSARMLSVEEAKRYAGGFDDPARLVSAFAGVSSNVGDNAISVRGNNPQSFQWKLEGVEIPNPNHFADVSTFGGGGLTALSAQLLDNSDFLSGAMPAEYSNALSGVFDIFMRTGNNQKHEHTFQFGAIGVDLSSEGPFSKSKTSSYLFNYRYSTLDLLAPILPANAGGTHYQDLSFKLNFPTLKAGTFSVWGMGLLDHSDQFAKDSIQEWQYDYDRENQNVNQYMGVFGLSHDLQLNQRQYLKTTLAMTGNGINMHTDIMDSSFYASPENIIKNNFYNFILTSSLNTKFGTKHTNKTGFVLTDLNYSMLMKEASNGHPLETIVDQKGHSTLISAYSSSLIQLSPKTDLEFGLTGQWFPYNNTISIEPRAALKYRLSSTQSLSFATGLYSRLERLNYYFIQNNLGQDINKDLGLTKAQHFVLGYDINLSEFLHLKIEAYYQHLFDVPVIADSSFSLINQQGDWFFDQQLQNKGKGRNYGVDITFEKYLSKGYYYLATISLFKSQYQGGDKVWRDTRYDRNFAINFLIGKEWMLGENKNHVLSLNVRGSLQGGYHYSPVDLTKSIAVHDVVFDESRAYSLQYAPGFTSHFTASYKINKRKVTHEFALKIINLTQYKEYLGFRYNYQTSKVDFDREATFVPNISYRIEF